LIVLQRLKHFLVLSLDSLLQLSALIVESSDSLDIALSASHHLLKVVSQGQKIYLAVFFVVAQFVVLLRQLLERLL
jgi:hypothetical protein